MESLAEESKQPNVSNFLQGLKKTSLVMDQEHPRGEHSINNRNELRKVLHLEMLYKENKVKKNPLKTSLEIITSYFLDHFGKNTYSLIQETPLSIVSASKMNNKLPLKCSENSAVNNNHTCELSDEDGKNRGLLLPGRHDDCDGDTLSNSTSPKKLPHKNKSLKSISGDGNGSPPLGREKAIFSSLESVQMAEPLELKRMSDFRLKAGLFARGSLSGPIVTEVRDPLRRRFLRRPSGLGPSQNRDADLFTRPLELSPTGHILDTSAIKSGSSSRTSLGMFSDLGTDKWKSLSIATSEPLGKMNLDTDKNKLKDFPEGRATVSNPAEKTGTNGRLPFPCGSSLPFQERQEKEIKTLLFGSNLCGFNEEWKVQNFTFSEVSQLRYGLVQNKGGPCGVLAAVQGCVLKNLLFGGEKGLMMGEGIRGDLCLTPTLLKTLEASGMQQFSPAGSYKADGVLEMLVLHKVAKYDDLLVFLQQNIHQFQTGPSGCILLTLSAVLSRSTDQVRKDFDMPTNCLIGAHGYCTQELVNLLLTGKAVSNVFNDMVELDSGNGNITLLKGITSRSDIGLLSLFEHYDVCQVGCYLKTPRYPIWVVCSESHFSILFSLQRDLLNDWKVERIFDLYYYDGLANQQKEIRLTVDTTQPGPGEKEKDLIPPLEHCIRTK
uniref:Ubiquitin carboxyl-terminal hydrolase MINDY n=1 Tax=Monodelphis domestica TaxID=13616 RepID=A0A5F8H256_MONDO